MTKAPLAWLLAACAFAAHAADPAADSAAKSDKAAGKAPTAQQSRMKACNTQAEGKKGDERKAFMKECLSAKSDASPAATAQQSRMKDCNAKAEGKKGDERKAFMKECLSKKA